MSCQISNQTARPPGSCCILHLPGRSEKVKKGCPVRNLKANWGPSSWSHPLQGNASHSQQEPEAAVLSIAKEMALKIKGLISRDIWLANMNHCNRFSYFCHLEQGEESVSRTCKGCFSRAEKESRPGVLTAGRTLESPGEFSEVQCLALTLHILI